MSTLYSCCDFFVTFYLWRLIKSNKQKNLFFVGILKVTDDADPYQNVTDPQRISNIKPCKKNFDEALDRKDWMEKATFKSPWIRNAAYIPCVLN
jgi:hypothetical protein